MPKAVFELYKDKNGKFRFRLKAPNGEIIATSEAYSSKEDCKIGIESLRANAPTAEVVVLKAWKKRPSRPFRRREGQE